MPSVPKTSLVHITAAARRLIAKRGVAALSMQEVAAAVGVQAPSLYKHVPDRAALVRAVLRGVLEDMRVRLAAAAKSRTAAGDLRAMAHAQRAYAQKSPHLYALIFAPGADADVPASEHLSIVAPILECVEQIGAPGRALDGARLLVSYIHGFVAMETAGAFRLSGDLDRAFSFGVDRVIEALAQ